MHDEPSRRDLVNAYLRNGIQEVDGWCSPRLWHAIWPLYDLIGDGAVGEIGVHEGKFFLGLAKTFGTGIANKAVAFDVFEMQEFNIDRSGRGRRDVFEENLDRYGIGRDSVHVVQADSLGLDQRDAETWMESVGRFKFFSVDGCHEVVHTTKDIEFAMSVISEDGIISVDDYYNPNWPGVSEAVAKMYLMRDFSFVPLLYTHNKMFLCSYSHQMKYHKAVRSYLKNYSGARTKVVTMFGFTVLSISSKAQGWQDLVAVV